MATGTKSESSQAVPGQSLVGKFGPHAPKVMLGAAVLGLVAVFLPAVTVSVAALNVSESVRVVADWRGKLGLVAYVGVGVLAGMMLNGQLEAARKKALACLIAAGASVLLAVWLLLSIGSIGGAGLGSISTGFGTYVNILAALALTAGSALQAKRAGVF
jgi:hypothetical protein